MHSLFLMHGNANKCKINNLFNKIITESIRGGTAVVASDALVKENCIGGYQIIANYQSKNLFKNETYHQQWKDNTSSVAEVIILLKLITVLEKKGKHINQGKIKTGLNKRKSYIKIVQEICKLNTCAWEVGEEIAMIKKKLKKIKFDIEMSLE